MVHLMVTQCLNDGQRNTALTEFAHQSLFKQSIKIGKAIGEMTLVMRWGPTGSEDSLNGGRGRPVYLSFSISSGSNFSAFG
jgi:hypothetical protein